VNRAYFHSPRAPDWLLFAPGSIDGRYPNSADGALWPEFLSAYEPDTIVGDILVLRKRSKILPGLLGSVRHVDARLGRALPLDASGPVFARIVLC
jgi:hypothetical protein